MLLTDKVLQFAVLPEASLGVDCYLSSLTTITDLRSIPKLLWTKFVSLDVVFQLVAEDAKAVGASWIIGIDIDSNSVLTMSYSATIQ
ncbi:hypothetical protein JHK87_012270 [Glycine soja]|nr:hypothetical protein JHK87_012270 [Glycine soja]